MRIRIEGMKRLARLVGGVALIGLTAGGCAGRAEVDEGSQAMKLAALPDLPGCDAAGSGHHNLVGKPIAGAGDLLLVYADGAPLCIDTATGATQHLGGALVIEAASSNPMPGEPGDPAASNPMPGQTERGTGDSNPMPGCPVASNPMPGQDSRTH